MVLVTMLTLGLVYTLYIHFKLRKQVRLLQIEQSVNPLKEIAKLHKEAVERQVQIQRDRHINEAKLWSPYQDNSGRKDN